MPVTVTVTCPQDGKTASDTVNINVIRPAVKQIVFEDVHFDFDRYSLRPEATRALDEAITAMQQNATLRIQIEGHTCNIGTAEYNLALGDRRANSVRDYLTSRGIAASRLGTVSYGEERPKHDNSREETRRLNRRAALVVNLQQHVTHLSGRPQHGECWGRPISPPSFLPRGEPCDSSTSTSSDMFLLIIGALACAVVRGCPPSPVAGVGAHRSRHRRRPRDHAVCLRGQAGNHPRLTLRTDSGPETVSGKTISGGFIDALAAAMVLLRATRIALRPLIPLIVARSA